MRHNRWQQAGRGEQESEDQWVKKYMAAIVEHLRSSFHGWHVEQEHHRCQPHSFSGRGLSATSEMEWWMRVSGASQGGVSLGGLSSWWLHWRESVHGEQQKEWEWIDLIVSLERSGSVSGRNILYSGMVPLLSRQPSSMKNEMALDCSAPPSNQTPPYRI
jgi:hypothetical protein